MRQDNKKQRNRAAMALVLCFSVVAIASVFTVKSNLDKMNSYNDQGNSGSTAVEQPVSKQVPTVDSKDTEKKQPSVSPYSAPLSGSVLVEFSAQSPVYSKTLDQYMIHNGLDIAAPLDTQVKSIGDGLITKVYDDAKYGITVEINHGDGLLSRYCNLSTAELVEVGDAVKKGQVISGVGETALFESLDVSHLHLELMKNGEFVNPADYMEIRAH